MYLTNEYRRENIIKDGSSLALAIQYNAILACIATAVFVGVSAGDIVLDSTVDGIAAILLDHVGMLYRLECTLVEAGAAVWQEVCGRVRIGMVCLVVEGLETS